MPIDIPDYALFSANVYGNSTEVRHPRNTLPYPDGWKPLDIFPKGATSTGFMARAYQSPDDTEIVIAYA